MFRRVAIVLAAVAMLGVITGSVLAAEKTHEGKVVSVTAEELVMTDSDGKNKHSHPVGPTARVTLNDKAVKVTDLIPGDHIKVTQDERGKVTAVAATRAERKK